MSRPLRIMYPDAWYHVMNRGRHEEQVFPSRDDYERFISILHEAIEMFALRVSAYCLMSNHYHLLVQTPDANLDRCMRHINGVYTQRYNKAHGFDGTLFRGRYKSIIVADNTYLLQLVRYIHRNPVRAAIVDNVGQYEWSSHEGYLSRAKKWDWLHKQFILSILAKDPAQNVARYKTFMGEEDNESILSVLSRKKWPSIIGDSRLVDAIKRQFFDQKRHIEVPESKRLAPDVAMIKNVLCQHFNVDESQLYYTKRGTFNEARAIGLYLSRQLRGESLKHIGEQFGIVSYSTVSTVIERFKARLKKDRSLERKVDRIKETLMRQEQT